MATVKMLYKVLRTDCIGFQTFQISVFMGLVKVLHVFVSVAQVLESRIQGFISVVEDL